MHYVVVPTKNIRIYVYTEFGTLCSYGTGWMKAANMGFQTV